HTARQRQGGVRIRAIASAREVLEDSVAGPVRVQSEHRSVVRVAAVKGRSVEHAARQYQGSKGGIRAIAAGEALQHGIAGSISVELVDRAIVRSAAVEGGPVKHAARQNNSKR